MRYETRISTIEQLENGIIRVETKNDVLLESSDLDENCKIYKEKLKIRRGLFLIIFNPGGESNAEARAKFANPNRFKMKIAEALVIKTLPHRIESNFYKNKIKPQHPVKVFSKEKEAIEWLLSFES